LRLVRRHALARPRIDLSLLDPLQQRLRYAADLRGNRLDRRPQRRVPTPRCSWTIRTARS
jgi:hypothetical protein